MPLVLGLSPLRDCKNCESHTGGSYYRAHAVAPVTGVATGGLGFRYRTGRARNERAEHDNRSHRGHSARDRAGRSARASDHLALVLPRPPVAALGACGGDCLEQRGDRLPSPPPSALAACMRRYRGVRGARARRRLVRATGHARRGRQLAVHPPGQPDHHADLVRSTGAVGTPCCHARSRLRRRYRAGPGDRPCHGQPAPRVAGAAVRPGRRALVSAADALRPGHAGGRRTRRGGPGRAGAIRDSVQEHRAARAGPPAARHGAEHADRYLPFGQCRGGHRPVPPGHRDAGARAERVRRRGPAAGLPPGRSPPSRRSSARYGPGD